MSPFFPWSSLTLLSLYLLNNVLLFYQPVGKIIIYHTDHNSLHLSTPFFPMFRSVKQPPVSKRGSLFRLDRFLWLVGGIIRIEGANRSVHGSLKFMQKKIDKNSTVWFYIRKWFYLPVGIYIYVLVIVNFLWRKICLLLRKMVEVKLMARGLTFK